MYISVTLLKLTNPLKIGDFVKFAFAINQQISKAEGVIKFKTGNKWLINNYTLSVWKSKQDMIKFISSGAHKEAMKVSKQIASGLFSYGYEAVEMPNYKEEIDKIFRLSKGQKI